MRMNGRMMALVCVSGAAAGVASGQPVNFGTFDEWVYPLTDFDPALWTPTNGGTRVEEPVNASPSVFYGEDSVLGMRISGSIRPAGDDDIVGIVLGYTSDDNLNPDADYIIIDWKRLTQDWNWADAVGQEGTFHDITGTTTCLEGLRVLRVRGTPTGDELWGGVDLPENDVDPWAPGGVTELARGETLGFAGFSGEGLRITADITATNLKVWVNGLLQVDIDGVFTDGGFGVIELGQDNGDNENDWSDWSMEPIPGDPPVFESAIASANVFAEDKTIGGTSNEDSIWTITETGTGASEVMTASAPNIGDVAFAVNGLVMHRGLGGGLVSVREIRVPADLVTAEIVAPGQFGGYQVGYMGVSTTHFSVGESDADIALSYFPYADGWLAGHSDPDGFIYAGSPGDPFTTIALPTPNEDDQDGLYVLAIDNVDSQSDGFLLVVGGSNEDNVASAVPMGNGTWRIGVRDSGSAQFGGPQTFERDDWSFVFVPRSGPSGVKGAYVSGFDGGGNAQTLVSTGGFTLTREGVGRYRLSVDGGSPTQGVLQLTSGEPILLDDPFDILADPTAPLNYWLSYAADGGDFLIQHIELATVNTPVDGGFAFAYVPFEPVDTGCPADLDGDGDADADDFFAYLDAFAGGNTDVCDIDGDGDCDADDFFGYLDLFAQGC